MLGKMNQMPKGLVTTEQDFLSNGWTAKHSRYPNFLGMGATQQEALEDLQLKIEAAEPQEPAATPDKVT